MQVDWKGVRKEIEVILYTKLPLDPKVLILVITQLLQTIIKKND